MELDGCHLLQAKDAKSYPDCKQLHLLKLGSGMKQRASEAALIHKIQFREAYATFKMTACPELSMPFSTKLHPWHITKARLWRKRVLVLDWPVSSPDVSIKNATLNPFCSSLYDMVKNRYIFWEEKHEISWDYILTAKSGWCKTKLGCRTNDANID